MQVAMLVYALSSFWCCVMVESPFNSQYMFFFVVLTRIIPMLLAWSASYKLTALQRLSSCRFAAGYLCAASIAHFLETFLIGYLILESGGRSREGGQACGVLLFSLIAGIVSLTAGLRTFAVLGSNQIKAHFH
jgi:hypothetical protein